MRCNKCGTALEPNAQAVASVCGHLFCITCAESIVQSDGACPVCEALITKNTVRLVAILQETSAYRLHLCGQTPETALSSALVSVNFYMKQQEMHYQMRETYLKKRLQKVQDQCKERLAEVHNGYQLAKRKYQEVLEQKHMLERDNEELQQKYSQKASQTRKLQEMLKASKPDGRAPRSSGGSRRSKQSRNMSFPPHQIDLDPFKATTSPSPVRGLAEDHHLDENLPQMHYGMQRQDRGRGSHALTGSRGHHPHPQRRRSSSRHGHSLRHEDPDPGPLQELLGNTNITSSRRVGENFASKIGPLDELASF